MASDRPPTIDPVAAAARLRRSPAEAPWLHEEVARRMEERLQWIRQPPAAWVHWEAVRGGLAAHAAIAQRYPQAAGTVVEAQPHRAAQARQALSRPWWKRLAGGGSTPEVAAAAPGGAAMLWSNMLLHLVADPAGLMQRWHAALAVDGFLMFSCLGPDTLRELRALYAALGWPPAGHDFTDMHDWGDLLVHNGFAEPVMDMERITLTFETPARLLQELRGLGGNLHPARFSALRGRGFRIRLEQEIDRALRDAEGRLALTFEIIYGHAFKPAPRLKLAPETSVGVDDLRAMLHGDRPPRR